MSGKKIPIAEDAVPLAAMIEPEAARPWTGKTVTSLNPDGTPEDPKAEFVAIGYPFLARSEDNQHVYVPCLGGIKYDVIGFAEELNCTICKPQKSNVKSTD